MDISKLFVAYDTAKANAIKGDFIDKLHSRYSVMFLFLMTIIIGIRQYDKDIITCWIPTYYSDDQRDYAHQLCWVNNTYYYPDVTDADLFPESNKYIIHYYQFILFILFGQALLFMIPDWIWKTMASSSGGYIKKLLDQLQKSNVISDSVKNLPKTEDTLRSSKPTRDSLIVSDDVKSQFVSGFNSIVQNENEKLLKRTSKNFNSQIELSTSEKGVVFRNMKNRMKFFRRSNTSDKNKIVHFMKPNEGLKNLTIQYMSLKVINLLNVIIQLVFMHYMFGPRFYSYGIDFFVSLWNERNPYDLTTQFPIITFCDYYIHTNLNKIHWNTNQCLLTINIIIEKLFVLIWFWFVFLLIVTVINILAWCQELFMSQKISFLYKYLSIRKKMIRNRMNADVDDDDEKERLIEFDNLKEDLESFYFKYLGTDGVFMLHMIKNVAGSIIFMDLLYELWSEFKKKSIAKVENRENLNED